MKKALLIGINYTGTSSALNGCINDVQSIGNRLVSKFAFKPENIRILTDNTVIKPTRENMESYIKALVQGATSGDTLVFHYSGHGSNIKDASGEESDGRDEVLVPLDYLQKGVIKDDWLFENLSLQIPQGVKLVCFMDCCHSGTMIDLRVNIKSQCKPKTKSQTYNPAEWTDVFQITLDKNKQTLGTVISFSGCQDEQTSADAHLNGKYQGAFTASLLEFLDSGKTDIKLRNILKEVNARMIIKNFQQTSQLSLGRLEDLESVFIL
jgi:hypothetical protein